MISKSSKNAEIIRPIILGKNIKRFTFSWDNLWIIFTRRGINIDNYPTIKEYLYQFYGQLRPRNNGEESGRKPGPYKWYEIQDNVAYYQEFEKKKIAWGNLTLKPQFTIVDPGYYINAPSAFIATDNLYLLGVLNSKVTEFYIKTLGVERSGGYLEYKPMFVEKMPIPIISTEQQDHIAHMVFKLLETQKQNDINNQIEKELEAAIFSVYKLTEEEIQTLTS